jgi:hypothetical protein
MTSRTRNRNISSSSSPPTAGEQWHAIRRLTANHIIERRHADVPLRRRPAWQLRGRGTGGAKLVGGESSDRHISAHAISRNSRNFFHRDRFVAQNTKAKPKPAKPQPTPIAVGETHHTGELARLHRQTLAAIAIEALRPQRPHPPGKADRSVARIGPQVWLGGRQISQI